ncbi:MAG: hypothetical protein NZ578_07905 [Candidatus Binatia bacterium]|nr:hypothetical protein [Candidatus Binatia bacterium]
MDSRSSFVRFAFRRMSGGPSLPLFCLLLSAFSLPRSLVFAQAGGGVPRLRHPPLVRIIGALAPLDEPHPTGLQTVVVTIKATKWRLRIREIKALTATTNQGWGLLKDLFPPRLRFVGPADLLALLQQEDIAGVPLILEGRLYVGDHLLYLTAVTTNP